MRKTTMYFDDEDDTCIEQIKKDTGVKKDAQAVRVALRAYRSPRKK